MQTAGIRARVDLRLDDMAMLAMSLIASHVSSSSSSPHDLMTLSAKTKMSWRKSPSVAN